MYRPRPAQRHPPGAHPELQGAAARGAPGHARSGSPTSAALARLVEPFDPERYNTNASLAENLLFGSPIGSAFDLERLADQALRARDARARPGCCTILVQVGYRLAQTMVELFADLPPDHEYFQPVQLHRARGPAGLSQPARPRRPGPAGRALPTADRERLLALTFKLIPARHRLGLITPELTEKVLAARRYFREHLPPHLAGAIAFFDPTRYNAAITIQDNMIFGKIAYGQAQAPQRIAELIAEVAGSARAAQRVIAVGLDRPVGIGGGRLSLPQRQKLGARPALSEAARRPDPVRSARSARPAEQVGGARRPARRVAGRTVIWALQHDDWARQFDQCWSSSRRGSRWSLAGHDREAHAQLAAE